ncbi:MAG TPA: HAD hydrolase-like protein [Myxococcales bacterium]|jgi:phosphoglycolate phosphatase/AHBA synthesis associated protein
MQPRAILFDLDGVLVKSKEAWFRSVEEAGRVFRGRPVTREEFEPTFGQGTIADVREFGLSCAVADLDRFYTDTFPRHAHSIWVHPDAAALLADLRAAGKRLALVTNTVSTLTPAILRAAGIERSFEHLACADLVPHPKPAPDLPLSALAALEVAAADAWLVGDSRYDRESARAAGVFFVGLGIDGDARIEDLSQLRALL